MLAKRPDGYHDLETWMQKLALYDCIELRICEEPGIRLSCSQPFIPENETNLAWRAADAFLMASGLGSRFGVKIRLEKHIPVAAGLGGGSSDAGAVLRGLNTLLAGGLSEQVLFDLGRRLGADIPFFVSGYAAALATGIGDRLTPVASLTSYTFVLVNPGFPVSTQWVYENFALTRDLKDSKLLGFKKSDPSLPQMTELVNDLEQVTIARHPDLGDIKKKLCNAGAIAALMSGSGPTVFGVFPDETVSIVDIYAVAHALRTEYGDNVFVVKTAAGA